MRLLPILLVILAVTPLSAQTQSGDVEGISVESLRGGIRVFRGYANGNVLALPTSAGTLLVDGQSAKRVAELDSALGIAGLRNVKVVVTTHYHGDHLEGNAHWRAAGARVLAHANVIKQAVKDTNIAGFGWHRTAADPAALPTTSVADSTRFVLGADTIYLLHAPRAHTDGDLLVWIPGRNVLHTGDIVELGAFPFLDCWGGGTLDGMIAATDRILRIANDETLIVPGHGPTANRSRVVAYRAMLVAIRDKVAAMVRSGMSLDTVLADAPLAEFAAENGGERAARRFTWLVYYDLSRR
jgi:glyoxylase-like metal-dependent hydrolase (beta-lactamase superfamily II)